ncbi:MAG: hypothetical protein ACK40M_05070 [Flavobacteriales bacterium]
MKRILTIMILALLAVACKNSKAVSETSNEEQIIGTVSHKYRAGGCPTVIIAPNGGDTLTLIPTQSLGKFDVDGLQVRFTYHPLRRPNPEGCFVGIPASIVGIAKAK